MALSLYDALLTAEPAQSELMSPSTFLNASSFFEPTPSSSSYLNLPPTPTPAPAPHPSHYQQTNNQLSYPYPYSHPHAESPVDSPSPYSTSSNESYYYDQLDAFELARATYYELLDWMRDLVNQAQALPVNARRRPHDHAESTYLLQAEMRRVNAAIVKQAEVVKSLARSIANPSLDSASSRSSTSSSSPPPQQQMVSTPLAPSLYLVE